MEREQALSFDLPGLELDVAEAEAEVDIETEPDAEGEEEAEFDLLDPECETESYTDKCKKWCFTGQGSENEHTLLKSSFEFTLEFTLEPELDLELPLRLGFSPSR